MGVFDFLTEERTADVPPPVSAAAPVVAGAEPVIPSAGEGASTTQRRSSLTKLPWQDKARRFYYDPDHAIDLVVEFVDLRSMLAGLYPARAKVRDFGNKWVTVDDEQVQAVADEWRDADSGEQHTLVVDSARELSIVGEGVHQEVVLGLGPEAVGTPRFRYRILGSHQLNERDQAVVNGEQVTLVQLRTDAGPRPRNGTEVPGRWTWAPTEGLDRMWSRGSMSHDARSPLQAGMRYLDRMSELEREHFQRTKSNLSLNRILLLATNGELKKGDPDPIGDAYWHAASVTGQDPNDLMSRYPVPFRVQDPGSAQILDLIAKVSKEDIEEYRHLREMFATAMPIPKQALLEGAGASQRNLNNWMLDEALHEQCVHPVLNDVFGSATRCYFRPKIRELQSVGILRGYDAEDLKMGWDPLAASLANADPETIYRGWQIGLIPESEANELLGTKGWTEDQRPGVTEYEHWLVARNNAALQIGPGITDLLAGWDNPALSRDNAPAPAALPPATEPTEASTSILAAWR